MKRRPFFFHTLGYQRNPFGALTDAEWVEIAVLPAAAAAVFSQRPPYLQLLGPMGSGKTTMLRYLAHRLAQEGRQVAYEYLAAGQTRRQTSLGRLEVLALDEAQRLGRVEWRPLLQWARNGEDGRMRLVVSSHKDLTGLFGRYHLPLITLHLEPCLTLAHWQAILERRLAFFALPGAARATLSPEAITYLHATFGHNLREAEYFLYEVWQGLADVGEITAETLRRQG